MAPTTEVAEEALAFVLLRFQADPGGWLGPSYVGVAVDALFLGILCCQTSSYYSRFPTDSSWNKRLVGVCFLLSVLQALELAWDIWQKHISGFGDWGQVVLMGWPFYLDPVLMAALTTTAQTFFTWRCFLLTGRCWLLLISLGIMMLGVVALGVALTLQLASNLPHYQAFRDLSISMFVLGCVVDVVITSTVWYKLEKSRRGSNRTTGAFITKWITLTCECALPPALCQLGNTVLFITMAEKNTWSLIFNFLTPRLYVLSLMYTLNSRLPVRYVPEPETYGEPSAQAIADGIQSTALTLSTFKARGLMSGLETRANSSIAVVNQRSQFTHSANSSVYSITSHTQSSVEKPAVAALGVTI